MRAHVTIFPKNFQWRNRENILKKSYLEVIRKTIRTERILK